MMCIIAVVIQEFVDLNIYKEQVEDSYNDMDETM